MNACELNYIMGSFSYGNSDESIAIYYDAVLSSFVTIDASYREAISSLRLIMVI